MSRCFQGSNQLPLEIRSEYLPFGKPSFSDEEIAAVSRVLRTGWIGMGPETVAFESELAKHLGVDHVVSVNSCTSALFLSLLVSGVRSDDEVICPSLTWCSSANVALYLGAKPVFCDVDDETICITPESVKEKLTAKTKAVIVVHFGGLAVDVDAIRSILPKHVAIIEDAAHAFGARFEDGRPVGASTNPTCFSFYANKNLSTAEGGAIALFDPQLADQLRSLRQHGMPVDAWRRFSQPKSMITAELNELGYKMNYTDLQASIGRVQLKRQLEFQSCRLEVAQYYYEKLRSGGIAVRFQSGILSANHARHLCVIQLPLEEMRLSRDELVMELRARNIGASIHYPPLHQMPLYAGARSGRLPNTEQISSRIMTLPISASMNMDDAEYVVSHITDVLK